MASASVPPADPRLPSFLSANSISWQQETWDFSKKLGSGRFATVYAMTCKSNSKKSDYAAKVTTLAGISPWARAQLAEELAIWQTLSHPNVVRLYGHHTDATRHLLILELAKGGELFERIVSMQCFSEQLAARQVLSALEYLHSFGVLHRDLKPENLLLESADDDARVKIADFGASKLVISAGAKTPCGSLGYAAPEQLRGLKFAQDVAYVPPYDKEVDLWSVGVITYILLSGSMPFDPASYSAENISKKNALEFPPDLFGGCSPEATEFIKSLLQIEPSKRLSAQQALKHPWLASLMPSSTGSGSGKFSEFAIQNGSSGGTDSSLLMPPPSAKLPTPGAATIPPTPRTPHGLTPLPTPRRLKELISAGKLKKNWGEQTEVARTGQPKEPAIGSEGEAARELAKKRTAEELEQDAEEHVPELMLPPEVSKRIRMASEESAASSSRSSA